MQTWLLPRAFKVWLLPNSVWHANNPKTTDMVAIPSVNDISHYLQAFYHGLSVKILPNRLNYVAWSDDASHQKKRGPLRVSKTTVPRYVGLEAAGSVTRIRTRHLEDAGGQPISAFAHQLNLDDILDCAVSILPEDAYALIILVDHDIYEDEDDDFCCGRAYGASRIAVVSSAQYNPCLDQAHHIDREHCWPASHCLAFLDEQMRDFTERQEISGSKSKTRLERHTGTASSHDVGGLTTENSMLPSKLPVGKGSTCSGAMTAAIQEHRNRQAQNSIKSGLALQSMYLLRIARTASHELGHCLGMDHCTYYACAMQGTASTNEDSRQPPFLCPVCLNKLAHAVVELNFPQKAIHGEEAIQHKRKWLENRHQKMRDYSIRQEDAGFASLAAWTAHILEDDPLQTVLCY